VLVIRDWLRVYSFLTSLAFVFPQMMYDFVRDLLKLIPSCTYYSRRQFDVWLNLPLLGVPDL